MVGEHDFWKNIHWKQKMENPHFSLKKSKLKRKKHDWNSPDTQIPERSDL